MADRLAKSLDKLRTQVSEAYPARATDSDGWVASAAHHQQNPSSDHEADSRGVVHAVDFTHDPAHGFDSYAFADFLLQQRDPRIKYVISNRRIGGDEGYAKRNNRKAWTWYPYNGSNPHTGHVHVSCNRETEDDDRDWLLPIKSIDDFVAGGEGKGSWYSQFDGQYEWRDQGDRPDSNALGVPDSKQGFAMYDRATLGKWRSVKAPNGVILKLQQTDIGPHPSTGRSIDIAAVAAEHFGYSPKNFPTDSVFQWSAIADAQVQPDDGVLRRETHTFNAAVQNVQKLLGFSNAEQDGYFGTETEKAVKWFQRRSGLDVDGEVGPLTLARLQDSGDAPATQMPNYGPLIAEIWMAVKPVLERLTMFEQTKSKFLSKGVWGGIIAGVSVFLPAAAPVLGPALGLAISADDAAQIVRLLSDFGTLFGSGLAIYGRIVADKKLT